MYSCLPILVFIICPFHFILSFIVDRFHFYRSISILLYSLLLNWLKSHTVHCKQNRKKKITYDLRCMCLYNIFFLNCFNRSNYLNNPMLVMQFTFNWSMRYVPNVWEFFKHCLFLWRALFPLQPFQTILESCMYPRKLQMLRQSIGKTHAHLSERVI